MVAKKFVPCVVMPGLDNPLVYILENAKPVTRKKTDLFNADIQQQIIAGKLKFFLGYKEVS